MMEYLSKKSVLLLKKELRKTPPLPYLNFPFEEIIVLAKSTKNFSKVVRKKL